MIKSLHIKNYALIEQLELSFSGGLTIITGETGAGKSILLGALGLIMGDRADTKALFHAEDKCVIEGRFAIEAYDLQPFFADNDLDYEPELIIRREILPSGKSRAFVNDTPTNLKVLQTLSAALVDLHQQFDTLDIHQTGFQLRLLDALAANGPRLKHYQEAFQHYRRDRQLLHDLRERSASAGREMEFLAFQLQELREAELKPGEQGRLEQEVSRLTHAEDTKRTTAEAFQALVEDEQSVLSQLQALSQSLQTAARVDPGVDALHQRLFGLIAEVEDLANELERKADQTEYDPENLQEMQERLDLLYRLEKKHQVASEEELITLRDQLAEQLSGFENLDATIKELTKQVERQEADLRDQAQALRQTRQLVAPDFAERVVRRLAEVAMPAAQLRIDFQPLEQLSPTGLDEVQFLFSANKGSQVQRIKDVASGGELSRLTLVTKSLVASAMALPTLIFDEIDSGVSGDVAQKMGVILRELSNHHQVVVITHSPQVAARADRHYFVFKKEKDERTVTLVRQLEDDDRIRAIATMLSQSPPSSSALDNARELINQG
ncbi:MAG: DNA repair protein RecN [Lewinella sp.]|nr:DNA repair protein RecN [Lewinella sp.]